PAGAVPRTVPRPLNNKHSLLSYCLNLGQYSRRRPDYQSFFDLRRRRNYRGEEVKESWSDQSERSMLDGGTERRRDGESEREREGEREGQRERGTERRRDGETERWRDGEMERWRDGETER